MNPISIKSPNRTLRFQQLSERRLMAVDALTLSNVPVTNESQAIVTTRLVGTWRDDSFEFIAGDDYHRIIHNGDLIRLDASKRHEVQFIGRGGTNRVQVTGAASDEVVRIRPGSLDFRSAKFRITGFHSADTIVHGNGGRDRLRVYDSDGDDTLRATQHYVKMTSNDHSSIAYGFQELVGYSTLGGYDRAVLSDSVFNDTFTATDQVARLKSPHFSNTVRGFDRVIARSIHGGLDSATLWDSRSDEDVFQSSSEFAAMFNTHFYNHVSGFDSVIAYANQGGEGDRVQLSDSTGDDFLISLPGQTEFSAIAYTHTMHDFERLEAFSSSGADRAYFFDSTLDDVFNTRAGNAKFYNSEYYIKANGFAQVDAFSTVGGNDRAHFHSNSNPSTLVALENQTRMYGADFDNTAHGFSRTYGFGFNGNDRAILYDNGVIDNIIDRDGLTRMYSDHYYNRVQEFESLDFVYAELSSQDLAMVFGGISENTVRSFGENAEDIRRRANAYIFDESTVATLVDAATPGERHFAPSDTDEPWAFSTKEF